MAKKHNHEPMSNVDAAWLGMDSSINLMIINAVMMFDEPVDFDRLKSVLEERLARPYDRFRQRVVEAATGTRKLFWEFDPYYDIRAHVRRIALPDPGDQNALQCLVSDLMNEPLDRGRPLWRFYLIENFGGGCAVFGRIHHCIADGIALIRVLLSLTDTDAGAIDAPKLHVDIGLNGKQDGGFDLLHTSLDLLTKTTDGLAKVTDAVRKSLEQPEQILVNAAATGLLTAVGSTVLARLIVMPADRRSAYRGNLGVVKRVVWSQPLSLDRVKQIGRATGTTVNDVLVAVVTGALRHDLINRGDDASAGDLHAMVPVNLRSPTEKLTLGNQFSLVYLALPITIEDRNERLLEVKRRMDVLKTSPEPFLIYQILSLLGVLPEGLAHLAEDRFASKASCVLTNLPGPRQTLYLAGRPLRKLMFWVPQSGDIAMGISIISYDGAVILGLVVDEGLIPDPDQIIEEFHKEFDALGILAKSLVRAERN